MEQTEKKKLLIFIACAYGATYLMGIFMYIGFRKGVDLNQFSLTQMLYPAAGVMLGMLLTTPKGRPIPKAAFITTLSLTALSMVLSIISIAAPLDDLNLAGQSMSPYYLIGTYLLIPVSIAVYVLFWTTSKESRKNAGIERKNIKLSIFMVALFLVLYFARILLSFVIQQVIAGDGMQQFQEWLETMASPMTWINVISLPINFFLTFLCFFGEEYGWRYYLQPLLQKKFGLRGGVLLLGLVWGLWHAPMDFFYYTTTTGLQMLVNQIITCTAYAIFFGYAYMKTQNIWVPVILHYLNNNLVPIIMGDYSADVLENQSVAWSDIPIALILMLMYIAFIFAKEYRKKQVSQED